MRWTACYLWKEPLSGRSLNINVGVCDHKVPAECPILTSSRLFSLFDGTRLHESLEGYFP